MEQRRAGCGAATVLLGDTESGNIALRRMPCRLVDNINFWHGGSVDHFFATISTSIQSASIAPTIVLGIAAMMAMINLRNSDLASRHRANTKEALYDIKSIASSFSAEDRIASLKLQNKSLMSRYQRLSFSFVLMATTLVAFAVAILFAGSSPVFGGVVAFLAAIAATVSIILLVIEFWAGPGTLTENNRILEYTRPYPANSPSPS